jgi:hypothetical protein
MSGRGLWARAAPLAILMLVALIVAACGSDEEREDGGGLSEADVQEAGLSFARCMREKGFDVPDPEPGVDGVRGLLMDGDRRNEPGFREAERDCRKHLEGLVAGLDEEQRREFEDARLEFAQCMREKGFDVPDPRSGADPEAALGELDLEDPRVQEAMDVCIERLPDPVGGG